MHIIEVHFLLEAPCKSPVLAHSKNICSSPQSSNFPKQLHPQISPLLSNDSHMENTNPSPSRHLKHAIEDFATRWWPREIIASIVSIIFLASIFIVFYYYDNQPLDNWSLTWRFTSVVSFITTIAQISMLIPITAGISQLKWLWYNEKHSLADIEKFDRAARGPFGAVFLIFSYPFKWVSDFHNFQSLLLPCWENGH